MIKGNTKRFIANIFAEFEAYYDGNAQGVQDDIKAADGVRHFVYGGGFYCYTSEALDFLARVYENTPEEKARFERLGCDRVWDRFVAVVSLYLPKWVAAKGVQA